MKALLLFLSLQMLLFASAPKALSFVDTKTFSGLWYEIARTYNSYEEGCFAPSVEYVLQEDESYKVFNRCFEEDLNGELRVYKGSAKGLKKGSVANLKMTYFWIFSKTYRVVYLQAYESAVVVDETMQSVWIMSRTPFMQKDKLQSILSFLSPYLDLSKLIYPTQDVQGRYK